MEEKPKSEKDMLELEEPGEETSTNILDEWDSDDGICGDKPASACKRLGQFFLLLVCFFGLLIMFSIGVMVLFNRIFNGKKHVEEEVKIVEVRIETPRLIVEPQFGKREGLIHCAYESSVTRQHVKRMNTFLKNLNPMSYNSQDCNETVTRNKDKPCRFDKNRLGSVCVKKRKYGFDDCRLCVALTLEKVIDWQPIAYENESVPLEIIDRYHNNAVTVSCYGENPVDIADMGPVVYYPPEGFNFMYFPYQEQEGYNTPLVMVHFKHPSKFVYINIECKVWAKNIDHDKNEGIAKFQLYLE